MSAAASASLLLAFRTRAWPCTLASTDTPAATTPTPSSPQEEELLETGDGLQREPEHPVSAYRGQCVGGSRRCGGPVIYILQRVWLHLSASRLGNCRLVPNISLRKSESDVDILTLCLVWYSKPSLRKSSGSSACCSKWRASSVASLDSTCHRQ